MSKDCRVAERSGPRRTTVSSGLPAAAVVMMLVALLLTIGTGKPARAVEAPSRGPKPRLIWEFRTAARGVAVSPSGDCVATLGFSRLEVFTAAGRPLWNRSVAQLQKWPLGGAVAVAPGCSTVALGGSSAYRYVWLLGRGRSVYVKTHGTPRALAFSRRGDLLTAATWAGHLYLIDARGTMLRDAGPDDGGSESAADLLFDGGEPSYGVDGSQDLDQLLALSRRVPSGTRATMSRDRQWVAISDRPSHGPSSGSVRLFRADGTEVFSHALNSADTMIAPDANFIAATGEEEGDPRCPKVFVQTVAGAVMMHQCPVALVFDRDGKVVSRSGCEGNLVLVSDDGQCILTHCNSGAFDCRDIRGRVSWSFPGNDALAIAYSRDLWLIATVDGERLRVFATSGGG